MQTPFGDAGLEVQACRNGLKESFVGLGVFILLCFIILITIVVEMTIIIWRPKIFPLLLVNQKLVDQILVYQCGQAKNASNV